MLLHNATVVCFDDENRVINNGAVRYDGSIIDAVGALPVRVVITEMRESVFFADLSLDVSGEETKISARPSDAIALAVRTGTPVFASPAVLDEAAVHFEDEDEEEQVAQFREFLEEVTVEDFLGGEPES